MDQKQLHSLIENLHRELASAESVDDESRTMLQGLVGDVERLAGEVETPVGQAETTTGQLENAALRFESEHPKLSMALGEVIEALNKLGI